MATSGIDAVSRAEIRLWRLALLAAFLVLWETATRRGWMDPFFVSQPTALAGQIAGWIRTGFIFRHLAVTLQETIIGFLLGTLLGIVVGLLFARWETLARIFDPLMVALNAMPRVVLAPLFILWFGLGLLSKVVMVISLVFFVVFFSTYTGIREVDRDLVNNARILGARPLIGAGVGEYLGSHEGMGWVISYAESMFNATAVLAGLLVLMAAVIVIDVGLKRLDARFSYWKPIAK